MEIFDAGKVRICVAATRVTGRDYVDIRAFVTNKNGTLRPTQSGVLIPVERLALIMEAAAREQDLALQREPAALYYFMEHVEDKKAVRKVHESHVFTTARQIVELTPGQHSVDAKRGYIFKCHEYTYTNTNATYQFEPTVPFAAWHTAKNKWMHWKSYKLAKKRS